MKAVANVRRALWLLFAATLVAPKPARAQTIELPESMSRRHPQRQQELLPTWVNQEDCTSGDVLDFATELTGYEGLTLEVWASDAREGVDCTQQEQRVPNVFGKCWRVFSTEPTAPSVDVAIRAQVLAGRAFPSGFGPPVPEPPFQACFGRTGHMPVTLFFVLVDADLSLHGTPQSWKDVGIDLEPPAAPTDVVVEPGDGRLRVRWTEPADTDLFDYGVFCDSPGDDRPCALPEAAARDPGVCATALAGAPTAVTGPLTRDVEHRVSVVARDTTGNRSDASSSACATPTAVKHDPKIIGGCGCDLSPAPTDHAVTLLAAAALLARHRRAARVRSNSK